jgi:hypothetical protein
LVVGASVATDSAILEDSITCCGFSADFLLAVFFVERDSAFAWTMPFLFCLAGGRAGGFSLVIGAAYRREVDILVTRWLTRSFATRFLTTQQERELG